MNQARSMEHLTVVGVDCGVVKWLKRGELKWLGHMMRMNLWKECKEIDKGRGCRGRPSINQLINSSDARSLRKRPPREWPWQTDLHLSLSIHSLFAHSNPFPLTPLSLIYSFTLSSHLPKWPSPTVCTLNTTQIHPHNKFLISLFYSMLLILTPAPRSSH